MLTQSELVGHYEIDTDMPLTRPSKAESPPNEQSDLLVRRNRTMLVSKPNRWTDHRAWLSSCLIHTFVLVGFGILWRPASLGTSGEKERPIGIALVKETSHGNEYYSTGPEGAASKVASTASQTASSLVTNNASGPPISIDQLLSDMTGAGTVADVNAAANSSIGSGLSGNGTSSGNGSKRGGGPKTKATFFGVEGEGSSFVYVVDRSDSMNVYEAGPMRAAKRELLKSLSSLGEFHQFQIVFYNDSVLPLSQGGGNSRMLFANEKEKTRASRFVRSIPGDGGTEHIQPLKIGLAYAPDVLFFLTDAEEPTPSIKQLRDLQQRAELSMTTIHAIQFNVGPASSDGGWIRALAEMNRGTYKYVDVSELPTPSP
jgi:hypothetical protein